MNEVNTHGGNCTGDITGFDIINEFKMFVGSNFMAFPNAALAEDSDTHVLVINRRKIHIQILVSAGVGDGTMKFIIQAAEVSGRRRTVPTERFI